MNKKITYLIWIVLSVITIFSFFVAYHENKKEIFIPDNDLSKDILFMDQVSQCPADINTNDRFVCLYNLAESTNKEADALANKLITHAPVRLKEITENKTGPVSFVYGGKDFLENLSEGVKKAQAVKEDYINTVCILAEMKIFGGSGMDLEREACRYHFTKEYLNTLKNLEGGLTTEE